MAYASLPALAEIFREAWKAADAEGREGSRVEDGLKAVFLHLESD